MGDLVVLRYSTRGQVSGALPTRVVGDGPALWLAPRTLVKSPTVGGRPVREASLEDRFSLPRGSTEREWQGDGVLILGRPGRDHAIWLMRKDGEFAGWYVQLEDAWRPFDLGFERSDHTLDIWIAKDGSWRWK